MRRTNTVVLGGGGGTSSSGITIGTTTITSGTTTRVLFDDAGVVAESAGLVYAKSTGTLTATVLNASGLTASRLVATDASRNLASNGALTTNKLARAASSGASLADSQILDDGTTVTVPDATVRTAGTGAATAKVGGALNVNVTPVSTTDQSEDVLMQYTLPQNTLSANGKGLRIHAIFTSSANGNGKTFKLYFGSAVIATATATTASIICDIDAIVARTAASAEVYGSTALVSTSGGAGVASSASGATASEDTTAAGGILIKGTGQNLIAGTITQILLVVEAIN